MKPHSGRKAVSRSARAHMRAAASNPRRLLRCAACLIVRAEAPENFVCKVGVCPKKFERIAMLNGQVIEAT